MRLLSCGFLRGDEELLLRGIRDGERGPALAETSFLRVLAQEGGGEPSSLKSSWSRRSVRVLGSACCTVKSVFGVVTGSGVGGSGEDETCVLEERYLNSRRCYLLENLGLGGRGFSTGGCTIYVFVWRAVRRLFLPASFVCVGASNCVCECECVCVCVILCLRVYKY